MNEISGCKHFQLAMGLSKSGYWLGNFAWDYLTLLASLIILVMALAIYRTFANFQINLPYFAICAGFFGIGLTFQCYILTFCFKLGQHAQTAGILLNQLLGMIMIGVEAVAVVGQLKALDSVSVVFSFLPSPFLVACIIRGYQAEEFSENVYVSLLKRMLVSFLFVLLAFALIYALEVKFFAGFDGSNVPFTRPNAKDTTTGKQNRVSDGLENDRNEDKIDDDVIAEEQKLQVRIKQDCVYFLQ